MGQPLGDPGPGRGKPDAGGGAAARWVSAPSWQPCLAGGPHLELLGGLGCIPGATGQACCSRNSAAEARGLQAGPSTARGAEKVAAPAPAPSPSLRGLVRSHSRWGLGGQCEGLSPSVGPGCSQQGCPHREGSPGPLLTRTPPPTRLTSRGPSRPSPGAPETPAGPVCGEQRGTSCEACSLQHCCLPAVGGSGSRGLGEGSMGPASWGRASRGAGCLGQPPACSRRGAGGSHSPFSRLRDGGWGGQPPGRRPTGFLFLRGLQGNPHSCLATRALPASLPPLSQPARGHAIPPASPGGAEETGGGGRPPPPWP